MLCCKYLVGRPVNDVYLIGNDLEVAGTDKPVFCSMSFLGEWFRLNLRSVNGVVYVKQRG